MARTKGNSVVFQKMKLLLLLLIGATCGSILAFIYARDFKDGSGAFQRVRVTPRQRQRSLTEQQRVSSDQGQQDSSSPQTAGVAQSRDFFPLGFDASSDQALAPILKHRTESCPSLSWGEWEALGLYPLGAGVSDKKSRKTDRITKKIPNILEDALTPQSEMSSYEAFSEYVLSFHQCSLNSLQVLLPVYSLAERAACEDFFKKEKSTWLSELPAEAPNERTAASGEHDRSKAQLSRPSRHGSGTQSWIVGTDQSQKRGSLQFYQSFDDLRSKYGSCSIENSQSKGLFSALFGSWSSSPPPSIVQVTQPYLNKPALIDGRKVAVRVYLIIARARPWIVFFGGGFVRVCLAPFRDTSTVASWQTSSVVQRAYARALEARRMAPKRSRSILTTSLTSRELRNSDINVTTLSGIERQLTASNVKIPRENARPPIKEEASIDHVLTFEAWERWLFKERKVASKGWVKNVFLREVKKLLRFYFESRRSVLDANLHVAKLPPVAIIGLDLLVDSRGFPILHKAKLCPPFSSTWGFEEALLKERLYLDYWVSARLVTTCSLLFFIFVILLLPNASGIS